jgi:hypothetical protein
MFHESARYAVTGWCRISMYMCVLYRCWVVTASLAQEWASCRPVQKTSSKTWCISTRIGRPSHTSSIEQDGSEPESPKEALVKILINFTGYDRDARLLKSRRILVAKVCASFLHLHFNSPCVVYIYTQNIGLENQANAMLWGHCCYIEPSLVTF